jgi:hypothetical protein
MPAVVNPRRIPGKVRRRGRPLQAPVDKDFDQPRELGHLNDNVDATRDLGAPRRESYCNRGCRSGIGLARYR